LKTLILIFTLLFAAQINAATFTVTRSDDRNQGCDSGVDCSLREAVNAANGSSTDDVITFNQAITIITLSNQIVIENNGSLVINGLGAKVFTINGNGQNNWPTEPLEVDHLATASFSSMTQLRQSPTSP
jgi:CSLREA domain-containing protein